MCFEREWGWFMVCIWKKPAGWSFWTRNIISQKKDDDGNRAIWGRLAGRKVPLVGGVLNNYYNKYIQYNTYNTKHTASPITTGSLAVGWANSAPLPNDNNEGKEEQLKRHWFHIVATVCMNLWSRSQPHNGSGHQVALQRLICKHTCTCIEEQYLINKSNELIKW